MKYILIGIVVLVLGLIAISSLSGKSQPPVQPLVKEPGTATSTAAGTIAFAKYAGGNWSIYVMNADGSGVSHLADCLATECYTSWSPDGTKIAFQRQENGAAIYVMDADGTNMHRLSGTPGYDVRPSWSPDGKEIVFNHVTKPSDTGVPETDVTLMNADGSNRHEILASDGAFNIEPRFSPDGTKIVIMSNRDHSQQIWVMNADGKNLKKLTSSGSNGDPVWSPDGSRISFGSNREGGNKVNIFTMKADGSDVRQITHFAPPYEAGDTTWTADGKSMALEWDVNGKGQSDPNVQAEVWTVPSDGSAEPQSTHQACASVGCGPRFKLGTP